MGHLQKCQTIRLYPLKTLKLHLKSMTNISNSPRFYATTMNLSILFVTPNQCNNGDHNFICELTVVERPRLGSYCRT